MKRVVIAALCLAGALFSPFMSYASAQSTMSPVFNIPRQNNGNAVFDHGSYVEIWRHNGGNGASRQSLREQIGNRQVKVQYCVSACAFTVLSLPVKQVCIGSDFVELSIHASTPPAALRGDKASWAAADRQTQKDHANLPAWARPKAVAAMAPQARGWVVYTRGDMLAAGYKPC